MSFSRGRRGATRTRGAPECRARTRASRTGPRARLVARTSREVPPPWPGDPRWDRERRRRTRDHRPRARMGRAGWRSTRARRARLGPLDRERTRSRTSRDPARRATRAAARCAPPSVRAATFPRPHPSTRTATVTTIDSSRFRRTTKNRPARWCASPRGARRRPPRASPWSPRARQGGRRDLRQRDARLIQDRHLPPGDGAHHRRARAHHRTQPASGCPSTCVPISAAAAPRLLSRRIVRRAPSSLSPPRAPPFRSSTRPTSRSRVYDPRERAPTPGPSPSLPPPPHVGRVPRADRAPPSPRRAPQHARRGARLRGRGRV